MCLSYLDHGFCLLSNKHGLCDLRSIGKICHVESDDRYTGMSETVLKQTHKEEEEERKKECQPFVVSIFRGDFLFQSLHYLQNVFQFSRHLCCFGLQREAFRFARRA